MKKLFWILAVLALLVSLGLLPFSATDVAELLPAQTVIITRSGDRYTVDIGAGVRAVGKTVKAALEALKQEVSGTVFFGTAEQVIVHESAADAVEQVVTEPAFRPAAAVLLTDDDRPDAEAITDYLSGRPDTLSIGEARGLLLQGQALPLPLLTPADGGYRIVES